MCSQQPVLCFTKHQSVLPQPQLESNIYFTSFSQQLTTLHPILFSPKQTNETSEFVRNQHKAELSPDAKATPAATPKPPSPGNADGGSDDRRKSSKWKAEIPFFNRSNEQKVFDKNLKGIPGVIAVLVGPPSCGKSRFLKEMVDRLGLGQDPPPVIFINSRLVRVNGPEAISKALVDEVASQDNLLNLSKFPDLVQGILEQVSMVAGVKTPVGNVLFDLGEKPVIVIDEANNLMDWTEPGPSQPKLKTMLDFVVAISKEANLVHVILATSDYFLASWLKVKGVATNNFRIHVLGDVTEEEAREFVYGTAVGATIDPLFVAAPDVAAPVVTWPGIINDPSEPIAVPEIIPKRDELPEWTEGQWATVLQRITTAPHHAVLRNELANGFGKKEMVKQAMKILLSMVKYNLLALRPYSTLARDLPLEVYGVDEEEVVTLPSPGHIWGC
ncbi:hypothetical protein KSW81_004140 [Nannochloris sp. 'desiccata']|nr:hypothetical protein KSW81_004140 [Chlorella desiccata (nom. nud.)]